MDTSTYGHVLIVDDDKDARDLMAFMVRALDLNVEVAHDGHDALRKIRANIPGFVVLDLMMPGLDGFAVLRHLQMNPKTRAIPILIMTAARLSEDDVMDLRGTVLGVIRKGDLDFDDVSHIITETLKDRAVENARS